MISRNQARINRAAFAAVAALSLAACAPSHSEQIAAVEDFGFTDVRLGSPVWFGCSKDDTFQREWTGRNAAGVEVHGVICSGFAKGFTVRITGRSRP